MKDDLIIALTGGVASLRSISYLLSRGSANAVTVIFCKHRVLTKHLHASLFFRFGRCKKLQRDKYSETPHINLIIVELHIFVSLL